MKINRSSLTSQILILMMAAVVLMIMIEAARAQSTSLMPVDLPTVAQASRSGGFQNNTGNQAQVLQITMPQKSLGRRIWEDTTLGYYHQFLGPTASGSGSETYNIFQESIDTPGSGRAPLQSFHALNLRHQINTDWAIGATLSASNSYTDSVINKDRQGYNSEVKPDSEFFNARAYISLPPMRFDAGTLFTTLSYEAPTSSISKELEMRYGWVATQSFAFKLPDIRWNAGLMAQVYRMYYKNNVQAPPFEGGRPTPLQTMILSGGPYVNYRFNDKWMLGSVVTIDYDQRGVQSGSRDFNNNLPHRGRVNLTYFPQRIKYLQTVGLFSQALLKYSNATTAFGADFSVRF